jgi:hypothetical protein
MVFSLITLNALLLFPTITVASQSALDTWILAISISSLIVSTYRDSRFKTPKLSLNSWDGYNQPEVTEVYHESFKSFYATK